MITIKSPSQIETMMRAGKILYETLRLVREAVRPGIDTQALDALAERHIRFCGALPSFKGYNGFPSTLCVSIDEEVVHGFPSAGCVLQEGQIVSIDCGTIVDGFQSDSAVTVPVGQISETKRKLVRVTEECFWKGAEQAMEGKHIGDIGAAVQRHAEQNGFGVVRSLCGHGIGREMHEDPEVPNFGSPGRGIRLRAGMTICVEPMITEGEHAVVMGSNGWVVRTRDGRASSHYEHTLLIRKDRKPLLLSYPPAWEEDAV